MKTKTQLQVEKADKLNELDRLRFDMSRQPTKDLELRIETVADQIAGIDRQIMELED